MSCISADRIVSRFGSAVEITNMKPAAGNSSVHNIDAYEWLSAYRGPIGGTEPSPSTDSAYGVINVINNMVTFHFDGLIFVPSNAPEDPSDIIFVTPLPEAVWPSGRTYAVGTCVVAATDSQYVCSMVVDTSGELTFNMARTGEGFLGFSAANGTVAIPQTTLTWIRVAAAPPPT